MSKKPGRAAGLCDETGLADSMNYNVCIDIGGTFTDCVVAERDKSLEIFKSPSTPGEFERGVTDVLTIAAEHYGLSLVDFLANCDRIVHGTTVSTNALVEGKVARVGFICNAGHPDILLYREAPRKRCFEFHLDFPEPFVPRLRTHEVGGRINFAGDELVPLDENDVRDAIDRFSGMQVEAIAVCLLWSNVNGAHESRVREIIHDVWPEIPITLSHELNPIPREYRRAVSSVINASLYPIVNSYVRSLLGVLEAVGFPSDRFLLANCTGGMMPPEIIIEKPIYSVMSGPTLAPIAARHLTRDANVVVVDMGGTTFDVSAIRDNSLIISSEAIIGEDFLGIPKVDVRSIGAGGGSIAWVDVGGLIHVGPQSAGAKPGPACYGAGGADPTITDANVVIGLIDPDYFLGGRYKLDRQAAERSIQPIAGRLGVSLVEAAHAMYATCNHNMIAAIEDITVKEGINPRASHLVAGGGATGCHIAAIASELGMERFMVPRFAAGLSAYGGLASDIRWEEKTTLQTLTRDFALDRVNAVLHELRERGRRFLERSRVPPELQRIEYAFDGCYEYQSWEIEVPFELPAGELRRQDVAKMAADFHATHERIYTIKDEDDPVQFVVWKVRAIGLVSSVFNMREPPRPPQRGKPEPRTRRPVYFYEERKMVDTPIYLGEALGAGAQITGPAVIEEPATTILLLPGMQATTDDYGNFNIVL
jgi:N-methylhydantoinase A